MFVEYLHELHANALENPRQLRLILEASEREIDWAEIVRCPLCPDELPLETMETHVANHLESLAWFVLQPVDPEYETGGFESKAPMGDADGTVDGNASDMENPFLGHTPWWERAEGNVEEDVSANLLMLGIEHPEKFTSMVTLARIYRIKGNFKEAEELNIRAVEAMERVLGTEHPVTLMSMSYLIDTYKIQGRWDEVDRLEAQLEEARNKLVGMEHTEPSSTRTMNLASTHQDQRQGQLTADKGKSRSDDPVS